MQRGLIDRRKVQEAAEALGLDAKNVVSLAVDTHRVEAVMFDLDADGRRYLIPASAGHYDDDAQWAKRLVYLNVVDGGAEATHV